jgi:GT2 family glycosyltransferase
VQNNKVKIATLCCSYNRITKTTRFLESLIDQAIPDGYVVDKYLLDDNSPDGTAAFVKVNFPSVKLISGSGSLFWAGGMRTLWAEVLTMGDYDFFLLLNDDVVLDKTALSRLLAAYHLSTFQDNVILGTVLDPSTNKITYGGQTMSSRMTGYSVIQEPDSVNLKACDIGNANIMLVDKGTVNRIGILPKHYTHSFADFDYSFTAVKAGIKVWLAPGYYGYCENDHGKSWLTGDAKLKKRIQYLYSPKGLAFSEYMVYVRRNFPVMLPAVFFKAWLKTLFPFIYDSLKK